MTYFLLHNFKLLKQMKYFNFRYSLKYNFQQGSPLFFYLDNTLLGLLLNHPSIIAYLAN